MNGIPTLTDIEIEWRKAGSGICIIVEGQTPQDDPWFYNQWFGGQARRFTFFPQDGWEKVVDAVAALRPRIGSKRVYGIIDRDFEPIVQMNPFPTDGILRTRKYTLENYLLEPGHWYKYIQMHSRRNPKPDWDSVEKIQAIIINLYQECLTISAYNWVLHQASKLDRIAFSAIPANHRKYYEHPRALANREVPAIFQSVQTQMNITIDLAQMYVERLAELQAMPVVEWDQHVSGKYILKLLRERFPIRLDDRGWEDVLDAYMRFHYEPPEDLVELAEAIWQDSQAISA